MRSLPQRLAEVVRRHPLASYFAIAYARIFLAAVWHGTYNVTVAAVGLRGLIAA